MLFEKLLHSFVMVFGIALILFSLWFVYRSITMENVLYSAPAEEKEFKGTTKPLPDFIVDKVKPSELEQLKP